MIFYNKGVYVKNSPSQKYNIWKRDMLKNKLETMFKYLKLLIKCVLHQKKIKLDI